jgi:hypothetical protein
VGAVDEAVQRLASVLDGEKGDVDERAAAREVEERTEELTARLDRLSDAVNGVFRAALGLRNAELGAFMAGPAAGKTCGNRGSHELNQGQRTPPKDHRIEVVSRRLRGQDHPQRGTRHSPMTPQRNLKKTPLKSAESTGERKHQRGTKKTHRNHNSEFSIQPRKIRTRSSLPPQHPSLSQDLTMKLSS